MDIDQLKTFEAVARLGSMSGAAVELHTVQSNITSRMQALEGEIGAPLFRRHSRGVVVTPAGQRFLPFAGRILKLLSEAQVAAQDEGQPTGTLALGSLETTAAIRLSGVLTEFVRTYPTVHLTVTPGTTGSLVEAVLDGKMDAAFVAGPIDHAELEGEVVFTEELVLVTAEGVPSLDALTRIPDLRTIVFRSGCSYRQRLETFLAGLGIVVAKPLEFGSLDAILGCVAAGLGVTLLPQAVVSSATKQWNVRAHKLPSKMAAVDTVFIRRKDAYVSSAMSAFVAISRSLGEVKPTRKRISR